MNVMKSFLYVAIFLHSFDVSASWFADDKKLKKIDLTSTKIGFKDGKFFASVEEKPSLLRQVFGMKGVQHKVETARLLPKDQDYKVKFLPMQKDQDYKVKFLPMQIDRSLEVFVNGKPVKEEDLLTCCCAIIEDCCGATIKKD